jgi:hypothetical protein
MNKFIWTIAATAAVVALTAFADGTYAKQGVCKDGTPPPCGGGGGKPPVEGVNNLSFPAVSETLVPVEPRWNPAAEPILGVHYSYGCEGEEMLDQFIYPNTSCVDNLAAPSDYLTAVQCTAAGAPCAGLPVSRIYWQKVDTNDWWADSALGTPRTAAYLDWGDGLEVVTWNERSVIRVETQPYGSLIPWLSLSAPEDPVSVSFDPSVNTCEDAALAAGLDPEDACVIGFQMWHVSGQGTTEQWGVRADDNDEPFSYNYESPFQIIHTNNARLNVAKLVTETATCPQPGGNPNNPPPTGPFTWNGSGWDQVCEVLDLPYTVELSVGGKYVYGYNLRMKNVELDSLCGSAWAKTGYYRLTFYTNGAVFFDEGKPVVATTAPPLPVAEAQMLPEPAVTVLAEDDEDEGSLYTPVIDYENNLTYLDICIEAKPKGGGNRK